MSARPSRARTASLISRGRPNGSMRSSSTSIPRVSSWPSNPPPSTMRCITATHSSSLRRTSSAWPTTRAEGSMRSPTAHLPRGTAGRRPTAQGPTSQSSRRKRFERHFCVRPSEPLGLSQALSQAASCHAGEFSPGCWPGCGVLMRSTPLGVSAGHFTSFRVVLRRQIRRFRRSPCFLWRVRFPAAPPKGPVQRPFSGSLAAHQHAINILAPGRSGAPKAANDVISEALARVIAAC